MSKLKEILFMGTTLGIMASMNSYISANTPKVQSVLEGEGNYYKWKYGDIFYKVKGKGKNLLLLHGIHTGASSFEWRENFSSLAKDFRVYAVDLMGFGLSSKSRKGYRANSYVKLIFEFIEDVICDKCFIIASSLSCAYAIKNASLSPRLIPALMLICPTPWNKPRHSEVMELLTYQFLSSPIIGRSIYNTLTSKALIRYLLETKTYNSDEFVTRDMVNYYHSSSHQQGSHYFLPSFVSGLLDMDVTQEFKTLNRNTWVLLGQNMNIPPSETIENLKIWNSNVNFHVFENCGILPHNEIFENFNKFVKKTLKEII